jgi:hypothetical protein
MLIQASELTAKPGKSGVLATTVTAMRDVLTTASGRDWHAWAALTGRPYGTFALSTRHAGYADMFAGMTGVMASAEWAALSATADDVLAEPAPSRLLEVIATTGELSGGPKQFSVITNASLSGGDLSAALGWSTQVAEHVAKLTGQAVIVATAAAGQMFRVTWLSGADTAEELDASTTAMNGDAAYLEMLAQAGAEQMFIEGSTERLVLVRMP